MTKWFKDYKLADMQHMEKATMLEHLGIKITSIVDGVVKGTMPVDARTHQPMGLLHGGASCALAESLGSIGAFLTVDPDKYYCVGLDINANHVRTVRSGQVYGKAVALHTGKTTQVWSIEITDEQGHLVCISRLTMSVVPKQRFD